MRISDWSSDVCSSDLGDRLAECHHGAFLALVLERDGSAGHLQIVVALRGLQRLDRLRRDRCVEDRTKFALRGVLRVVRVVFPRSDKHKSELQSLLSISYDVFWFNK